MFDTFAYFIKCFHQVCLVLGVLLYIFQAKELFYHCTWIISEFYWYVCESYNGVCINIFMHLITVSVFLFLCMLYNIIVGYTSPWYFVIYLTCAWVVPPLHHCCIYVCINMIVNVISMVTTICLCTLYDLILGCATS